MAISKTRYTRGIVLTPDDIGVESIEGELKVALTAAKFQVYLGGALRNIVTENGTATLTNKTIDANGTGNSITNLETADLAAGVLNTNLATPTPTNVQVPSALAAKTYADSVAASGDATVQANLTAHITNPTGAHSASAITNVPAGNLAATDVQSALNELQTDVDTRATSAALTAHISNATGAHAASAIANTPSGNLAAVNVQGALNELQTDVDGRVAGPASATNEALAVYDGTTGKLVKNSLITQNAGSLSGIVNASASGVITAVGLTATTQYRDGVVSNAQTGTAITLSSITAPIIVLTNSGLVSIGGIDAVAGGFNLTLINRTGNAISILNEALSIGTANQRIITGTKADLSLADQASILLKYDSVNTRFSVIGGSGAGGGASLATILQLTGTDVPTWVSGNNAAFLGGGTLAGTFVANTSTPLQGVSSYLYTQAAGSLNDYIASAVQPVDVRFRGNSATLTFPYTYTGTSSDINVIVYCATTLQVLSPNAVLQASTTNAIFRTNVTIPAGCTGVRIGYQVAVLSTGAVFSFDSVQLSSDTTVYADIANQTQSSYITGSQSVAGGASVVGAFTGSSGTGVYSYNTTTGLYTALKTATINMEFSGRNSAAVSCMPTIFKNSIALARQNAPAVLNNWATASAEFTVISGDTFRAQNDGATTTDLVAVATTAIATNNNILSAPDTFSTDTAPLVYASSAAYTLATLPNAPVGTFITYIGTINTFGTRVQTTTAPTQTTASMNSNGILLTGRPYNSAGVAATPSSIAIQIGKGLKGKEVLGYGGLAKTTPIFQDYYIVSAALERGTRSSYDEVTGILTLDAGQNNATTTTAREVGLDPVGPTGFAAGYFTINASKNPALTGLNISAVAARAVQSSAQSIPSGADTTIVYDAIKTFDTHGALNNTTGIFTAPEAGYYQVNAGALFSTTWAAGNTVQVVIVVNGTIFKRSNTTALLASTYSLGAVIEDVVYLAKGGTVRIDVQQTRGTAASLINAAVWNSFSISKISVG